MIGKISLAALMLVGLLAAQTVRVVGIVNDGSGDKLASIVLDGGNVQKTAPSAYTLKLNAVRVKPGTGITVTPNSDDSVTVAVDPFVPLLFEGPPPASCTGSSSPSGRLYLQQTDGITYLWICAGSGADRVWKQIPVVNEKPPQPVPAAAVAK